MLPCVAALEAVLLPCLPARSLQSVDRSLQSSHQSTERRPPSFPPSLLLYFALRCCGTSQASWCSFGPRRRRAPVDVERHARDFMEAAKKLQSYFISLQREDQPTAEEMLRKGAMNRRNMLISSHIIHIYSVIDGAMELEFYHPSKWLKINS
uniref:Uncharacterized protein n=1 Tax=Zea mays TaxID=4577 RepID=A0A804MH48_MAIZE